MDSKSSHRSLLIILAVFALVVVGTLLLSLLARGYQLDTSKKGFNVKVTGLFSATSKPKAASVYIDNILTTATDDTINLNPGNYQIKIAKNGYLPWEKKITIEPELVYQSEAQLYYSSPELIPITSNGISNPQSSADYSKIIYSTATSSAGIKQNHLYVLEQTEFPLNLVKSIPKLLSSSNSLDWSKYSFQISPNSKQVLVSLSLSSNFLFSFDQGTTILPTDISSKIASLKKDWQKTQDQINSEKIAKLPPDLKSAISTTSSVLSLNSTSDKILYQANQDIVLAPNLISPPPAQSTQIQQRSLQSGLYYVYDIKDDTNYFIGNPKDISRPFWVPNSNNLAYTQSKNIQIVEYDGTNSHTMFTTPTTVKLVAPNLDGTRLIIAFANKEKALENLYYLVIRDR